MIVAGIDIGNRTTEVAVARIESGGKPVFLAESLVPTTGIKGTRSTLAGVRAALQIAADKAGLGLSDIDLARINEASPVVAGIAMQAITETLLTDSTLIGHNPETPGGSGLGFGITMRIDDLAASTGEVIAVVPAAFGFDDAAQRLRAAIAAGIDITGAIVQADDGVLIANRLGDRRIPIVDEVHAIDRVPLGQPAAIEVAPISGTIQTLCNPYGLATLFGLDADATARVSPAARALTGLRSAVVVRTPEVDVVERRIEAGALTLTGDSGTAIVELRAGAAAVMSSVSTIAPLRDAVGTPGTSAGAMFQSLRAALIEAIGDPAADVSVRDLLAADLAVPQPVRGGLSNEVAGERAVALAAMVETGAGGSGTLANAIAQELRIRAIAGGLEADAGIRGALTTPGTGLPLCVIDLGSGSTNAARIDDRAEIARVHLAGGGALVDLLIGEELGIADPAWREDLKRYPVAHVDGFFTLRHEHGAVEFLAQPVSADLFGRTVLIADDGLRAVPGNPPVATVVAIRQHAKRSVFGANALRALQALAPAGNPRFVGFVALIGGSALDFELPGMLAAQLAEFGIVTGTANVRGRLGPRNAVATGLVL